MDSIRIFPQGPGHAINRLQAKDPSCWVQIPCIQYVPRPENLGFPFGVVGIECTDNHVALSQDYRVKICRSDWSAGEGSKNGGFAGLSGHREVSIRCLPTNFETVIVPIPRDWVYAELLVRQASPPLAPHSLCSL